MGGRGEREKRGEEVGRKGDKEMRERVRRWMRGLDGERC